MCRSASQPATCGLPRYRPGVPPDRVRVARRGAASSAAETGTVLRGDAERGAAVAVEEMAVEAVNGSGPRSVAACRRTISPSRVCLTPEPAQPAAKSTASTQTMVPVGIRTAHSTSLWVITPYCWHRTGSAGNSGTP
ncbi:hypothetical protein GCM10017687_85600 [Streptomyces echinatus]